MSVGIKVTSTGKIPAEDLGYNDKIAQHLVNIENAAVHQARVMGYEVPKPRERTTTFEVTVSATVTTSGVR